MMGLTSMSCYAAAAGLTAHLGYFIHGERHRDAPAVAALSILTPILMFWAQVLYFGHGFILSAYSTAVVSASFTISLWASMVTYRLLFHPLRNFPGPVEAKVSKIWHSYNTLPRFDGFRWLDRMHQQYGDFVRTGPNEIAIFDPNAVPIILGPGSRCTKGPWYDSTLPLVSLQTTRDKQVHAKRRRIWDKGFGVKALRTYEERILSTSHSLIQAMKNNAGSVINASEWFLWYSFDTMGAIAFGKSFGAVENAKNHFAIDILNGGTVPFALFSPIPWAFVILSRIPGSPFEKFVEWCSGLLEDRRKVHAEMEISDVMSNLIEDYNNSQDKARDLNYLNGDSRLIVLAGTETTAGTLTHLFYFLAAHPSKQALLRAELLALPKNSNDVNFKALQDAPLLNGVINETLRLWPPVLSGLQYLTPPEGITVGKTFIPGNVTVFSPAYTVQRLESCFVRSNDFIPERWFSRPELIINKAGYAPFSLGASLVNPHAQYLRLNSYMSAVPIFMFITDVFTAIGQQGCVGKQLALFELRTIVSLLLTNFDVAFAPGDDGSSVEEDLADHFASTPGNLRLVFTSV